MRLTCEVGSCLGVVRGMIYGHELAIVTYHTRCIHCKEVTQRAHCCMSTLQSLIEDYLLRPRLDRLLYVNSSTLYGWA